MGAISGLGCGGIIWAPQRIMIIATKLRTNDGEAPEGIEKGFDAALQPTVGVEWLVDELSIQARVDLS